jgi:heme O synthase-like polyprenyltransferase
LKIKKEIAKSRLSIYAELSKLNILSLVLIATILGYYLGTSGLISWKRLFITLLGTALTASGSGALNHYLERETDKFMVRTKNRPLPAGLIKPAEVMNYGVLMVLAGIMILVIQINMLTGWFYSRRTPNFRRMDCILRIDRYHGLGFICNNVSLAASSLLFNSLDL